MGANENAASLPLPAFLEPKVALDLDGRIVYVDSRSVSDAHLITWQARNKALGFDFKIIAKEMQEIVALRNEGFTGVEVGDAHIGQDVRKAAIDMILDATRYQASDIHVMLRGQFTEVQLAIKDHLRVLRQFTHDEGDAILRAIYQGIATVRDASFNRLQFQNAQIAGSVFNPSDGINNIRIVSGPCYPQDEGGAFMTMRLQYTPGFSPDIKKKLVPLEYPKRPKGVCRLEKMGYSPKQIEKLGMLMNVPSGMIIFTGPTGSGKTNSIFELMQEIARSKPHKRQVTVEDPVEFPMPWAVQMAVTNAATERETGEKFSECVRVMLRMAPHVMLFGEMRGPEVVVAALEASLTGHLIMATLHVTDPFAFVERFELMDRRRIDRRVFCDSQQVRAIIGQRLIRRLCPHCSKPLAGHENEIGKRVLDALATWGSLDEVRIKGAGCEACSFDGDIDRFAVAEIIITDADLMADFIKNGTDVARSNYRKREDADLPILDAVISHCLHGLIDPRNIEDAADLIQPKTIN